MNTSGQGPNASGDRIKHDMQQRRPAQRCAGVRFNRDRQALIYLKEEQKPNDQESAIPPAAMRPVGPQSGGTALPVLAPAQGPPDTAENLSLVL
jgi:secreted protein with Ig-like and vWFA domain